jgi:hypothetical protein
MLLTDDFELLQMSHRLLQFKPVDKNYPLHFVCTFYTGDRLYLNHLAIDAVNIDTLFLGVIP